MKRKPDQGFTLVELMMTMVVFGVLATITVYGIQTTLPGYRLNGAARLVRGDLVLAKSLAAREMREHRVVFTSGGHRIEEGNLRTGSDSWVQAPGTAVRDYNDEFEGVSIASADTPVFRPNGTSPQNYSVTIANENGGTRDITVSMPGRIRIEE